MTFMYPKDQSSGTTLEPTSPPSYHYPAKSRYYQRPMRLLWALYQEPNPTPVNFGHIDPDDVLAFATRTMSLLKLERQHRERLAGVSLDPTAQKLLCALDQETSIRWEDLPEKAESVWSEASRSAALLVGANLCEVSPTRIRLNEYGDKLLAESSSADEANREVAS